MIPRSPSAGGKSPPGIGGEAKAGVFPWSWRRPCESEIEVESDGIRVAVIVVSSPPLAQVDTSALYPGPTRARAARASPACP